LNEFHSFSAYDWLFATDVTLKLLYSRGSKPELTEKVDDQHHGTNKAWLDWFEFGFVNSKLILQTWVCSTTIMVQVPRGQDPLVGLSKLPNGPQNYLK